MNECGIVQDLLPLYADGAASAETEAFIRRHLAGCPRCAKALRRVKREAEAAVPQVPVSREEGKFWQLQKKIRRRRVLTTIAFGAVAASAVYFAVTDLLHLEQENRKDM